MSVASSKRSSFSDTLLVTVVLLFRDVLGRPSRMRGRKSQCLHGATATTSAVFREPRIQSTELSLPRMVLIGIIGLGMTDAGKEVLPDMFSLYCAHMSRIPSPYVGDRN